MGPRPLILHLDVPQPTAPFKAKELHDENISLVSICIHSMFAVVADHMSQADGSACQHQHEHLKTHQHMSQYCVVSAETSAHPAIKCVAIIIPISTSLSTLHLILPPNARHITAEPIAHLQNLLEMGFGDNCHQCSIIVWVLFAFKLCQSDGCL